MISLIRLIRIFPFPPSKTMAHITLVYFTTHKLIVIRIKSISIRIRSDVHLRKNQKPL
jgi:hypothetical protein